MKRRISTLIRWTLVIFGIYIAFQVLSGIYTIISGGNLTDILWSFASDLNQDQKQRTNFLILGTGGEDHDGGDLTDTFLVASYNHELKTLSMLSIPRDLWSEAGDGYGMRLNRVYEYEKWRLKDSDAALESVSEVASKIANLPIHYYAKVDFEGFTDFVDALGGIKVLVEYEIDDPYYPCPNLIDFCPFQIAAGMQQMDGETALKFARSRKTTSDFDRAARQQKVIEAIREKAREKDVLTPGKIKNFWKIFKKRVETNLRLGEIIALGKVAEEFNKQNIAQIVLSDEPTFVGGLLYAPNREDYGGAAVLVPQGDNFLGIHQLTDILFGNPRVLIDQLAIEILNGSGKPGIAKSAAYYLNRYALNTMRVNNYPDGTLPRTTIYYYDEEMTKDTLDALSHFIDAPQLKGPVDLRRRGFDITIVLGEDWEGLE